MNRTGILSDYRSCPRHGSRLELVVVDQPEIKTHLSWYCSECLGCWSEHYFTVQAEARLPLKAMSRRFSIACPSCGSTRSALSCPCGCLIHYCLGCQGHFAIEFEVTRRSCLPEEQIKELNSRPWLDENSMHQDPDRSRIEHLGIRTDSVKCLSHPEVELTLALNHSERDERFRYEWFCKECNMGHDSEMSRSRSCSFQLHDAPSFHCWSCNHVDFVQSEDLLDATCNTCGTSYRLSTVTSPDPDPRNQG